MMLIAIIIYPFIQYNKTNCLLSFLPFLHCMTRLIACRCVTQDVCHILPREYDYYVDGTPSPSTLDPQPPRPTIYSNVTRINGEILTTRCQNKLISTSRSQRNAPLTTFKTDKEHVRELCQPRELSVIVSRILICCYILHNLFLQEEILKHIRLFRILYFDKKSNNIADNFVRS